MDNNFKPFLCDAMDKATIRTEWEKWLRSLRLYLEAEEVNSPQKKRSKLLHLGGPQLQEVAYSIPGAIVEPGDVEEGGDPFEILVKKLSEYFSPQQNSTFERHLFRTIKPEPTEPFNKFLLRVRSQAAKCTFGKSPQEALEINLKDKLIDNWAPVELKRKLLEKERTLEDVIELCRVHEEITKQSAVMAHNTTAQDAMPGPSAAHLNKLSTVQDCGRCGSKRHSDNSRDCPAAKGKCRKCGRVGHFAFKCRTRSTKRHVKWEPPNGNKRQRINFINRDETANTAPTQESIKGFECFQLGPNETDDSYSSEEEEEIIECNIGGIPLRILIDSGSKANVVSGKDWDTLNQNKAVMWDINANVGSKLRPYASKAVEVGCTFTSTIGVPDKSEIITTFNVISDGDTSLIGKQTAKKLGVLKLGLRVNEINKPTTFPKIKNIQVKLSIDKTVRPVQQPARRIPIAVEGLVDKKLTEALQKDIIEKVEGPSEWVSPIVVMFKGNGDIRICVDMRRPNEAIQRENYPLPTFDTIMAKLRNAQYFSKLDLSNAYHQLELSVESRPITTFITHKGMFRYKRLMFGVNSAPEIFQRIFEEMLSPCKNCTNYLDDIIVYGTNEGEHDRCLQNVLEVLKDNNVCLNEAKCIRKTREVYFLGHKLSAKGIDADSSKVQTIMEFRAPANKEEVRSFLGLVTYLGKFISDLGTLTEPLRNLTKKDIQFIWSSLHQQHFDRLKEALAKLPTLAYFDPSRRTRLIADASPVALGAVLIQFEDTQTPRVIAFASKSLTEVEKRYSQTEKESLALVWAVERFYFYLAGLEFELVTDHKPLETIFKPTSKPPLRIERWLLRLQAFKFKVIYQSGKSNIADSLSRLCQLSPNIESFDIEETHHVWALVGETTPKVVTTTEICSESKRDEMLSQAVEKTNSNSWEKSDANPYTFVKEELTTLGPILLRGSRIVIPESLRQSILKLAHEGHPGESAMKRRLRSKVWWPLIDREAEKFVKNCRDCLLVSRPERPPLMSRHKFPEGPWLCVAIDLMKATPLPEELLVIIDYYSRYHEIKFLKSTTSTAIITQLREIFCRMGFPKSIRADNGPQFTSIEFKQYCGQNNIELIHTPPYWPQANGEVERMNRTILKRLKISYTNKRNYKQDLQDFILMYNVTPHSTTGKSPSQLMWGRNIRDKIPSLNDIIADPIDEEAQDRDRQTKHKGKEREDEARKAVESTVHPGDKVLVKNSATQHKLAPTFSGVEYVVLQRLGNEVILHGENHTIRRHVSHVKRIPEQKEDGNDETETLSSTNQALPKPMLDHQLSGNDTTEALDNAVEEEVALEDNLPKVQNATPSTSTMPKVVEPLKLKRTGGVWQPK